MKKSLSIMLTIILSVACAMPVFGSSAGTSKLTVSMEIPENFDYAGAVYALYSGNETDLFAELNAENNYRTEINAAEGTYSVFQIIATEATHYEFLAERIIDVVGDTEIHVYIRDNGSIINATGETPTDIVSMGEALIRQNMNEEEREAASLMAQQYAESSALPQGYEEEASDETKGSAENPEERETKITSISSTSDSSPLSNIMPLIITGAIILGVGVLVVVAIMLRKISVRKEKSNDEQGEGLKN